MDSLHKLGDSDAPAVTEARPAGEPPAERPSYLASGIAHDINKRLAVVLSQLEVIRSARTGSETRAAVAAATQAALGAGRMVEELLGNPPPAPVMETINLSQLVRRTLDWVKPEFAGRVVTRFDCPHQLWPVAGDPAELESVLLNLIVNARDAMPAGGRLTIGLRNAILTRSAVDQGGEFVLLRVADTGHGMSPEQLLQARSPFFTTKPPGKGSGLGLSMADHFAKKSNGRLTISSVPGRGTMVALYLPRVAPPAVAAPRPAETPTLSATILLVEDDAPLRSTMAEALRSQGHHVIEASDAREGADHLADGIDLVITDLTLPGVMTGADLAHEARRRIPNLRVLMTSGRLPEEAEQPQGPREAFLLKPYRMRTLAAHVKGLLEG